MAFGRGEEWGEATRVCIYVILCAQHCAVKQKFLRQSDYY